MMHAWPSHPGLQRVLCECLQRAQEPGRMSNLTPLHELRHEMAVHTIDHNTSSLTTKRNILARSWAWKRSFACGETFHQAPYSGFGLLSSQPTRLRYILYDSTKPPWVRIPCTGRSRSTTSPRCATLLPRARIMLIPACGSSPLLIFSRKAATPAIMALGFSTIRKSGWKLNRACPYIIMPCHAVIFCLFDWFAWCSWTAI